MFFFSPQKKKNNRFLISQDEQVVKQILLMKKRNENKFEKKLKFTLELLTRPQIPINTQINYIYTESMYMIKRWLSSLSLTRSHTYSPLAYVVKQLF